MGVLKVIILRANMEPLESKQPQAIKNTEKLLKQFTNSQQLTTPLIQFYLEGNICL